MVENQFCVCGSRSCSRRIVGKLKFNATQKRISAHEARGRFPHSIMRGGFNMNLFIEERKYAQFY